MPALLELAAEQALEERYSKHRKVTPTVCGNTPTSQILTCSTKGSLVWGARRPRSAEAGISWPPP